MLKMLRVQNWKSFENASLYIDPLTILIGTNASGKSNTLDALLFLQRTASGVGIFQAINGDLNLPMLRGGLEWVCRKPGKSFSLELLLDGEVKNQDYKYELQVQVNGAKAEVNYEALTLLKYRPRRQAPQETKIFYAEAGPAQTPAMPVYFSTGTSGPGKRIDRQSHPPRAGPGRRDRPSQGGSGWRAPCAGPIAADLHT